MKPKDLDKMTKPELVRLARAMQKRIAKLEQSAGSHKVASPFPWSASLPNAFEGRN